MLLNLSSGNPKKKDCRKGRIRTCYWPLVRFTTLTFGHEHNLCDFGCGQFDDVRTLTVVPTGSHVLVIAHHSLIIYDIRI